MVCGIHDYESGFELATEEQVYRNFFQVLPLLSDSQKVKISGGKKLGGKAFDFKIAFCSPNEVLDGLLMVAT